MKDSQRLTQIINDSKRFLSEHNMASLDQMIQGGEAVEWQPIAKRIFVALLILENVQKDPNDAMFIENLYVIPPFSYHGCDVELFRSVYLSN